MTETTWSEEVAEPPKKKGIPLWVWGCGGGCLLAVIAALAVGVFLFGWVQEAVDPAVVWPKIAEILPFDEQPPYTVFGWTVGAEIYVMVDEPKEFTGILFPVGELDEQEVAEMDQLFKGEIEGGAFGVGEMKDTEVLTIDVAGRSCRAVRYASSGLNIPGIPQNTEAENVLIDLSRDPQRFVLLVLVDPDGEVDQADIDAFLAPFDPWR